MAAPLAATYVPPAPPLPAWLSITCSPTATAFIPYTVATLLPNGVPTLLTSAAQVTQYDTATLQLPITVDSRADVEGLDLGSLYTTAGGTEPTVVRELGGTRAFTLGSATRALAAGTGSAGGGEEGTSAAAATAAAAGAASSTSSNRTTGTATTGQQATTISHSPSPAASNAASSPSVASATNPAASGGTAAATSATTSTAAQSSLQAVQTSLQAAQSSISAALASATQASTADPSSVASLRSALASASSALAVVSSASTALPSAPTSASLSSSPLALPSSISPVPSSPSSASSPVSVSLSSTSTPLASDTASPSPASASERLNSLTPSQLAAAIAAPICFFFFLIALLLLCCCCVRRRRRKRAEAAALAAEEGDDGEGGKPGGGGGGAGGGATQEMQEEQGLLGFYAGAGRRPSRGFGSSGRRQQRKITWEWVPARTATPKQVSPKPDQGEGLGSGGRTSRASGRSVLAALTGGLLGAGAAAPRSPLSRRVDEEKVKGKKEGGEEEKSLSPAMSGAGLLAVRSASRASYSPVVGEDRDGAGGQLQDVDLTSPRLNEDDHGHFAPLPLSDDEGDGRRERIRSLQPLPPIVGTDGALRLSRYYTPPDEPSLSPPEPQAYDPFSPTDSALTFDASSPSSYDSPPLRSPPLHAAAVLAPPIPLVTGDSFRFGPVQDVTRSLDQLRDEFDGADAAGGAGGEGKRQTRLGYLSWSTAGRESVATKPQQEKQLTPPPTPSDGDVPPRADTPSADDHTRPVVSEMGWLSGRWSGLLRSGRGSDEEERVGSPDEGEEGEESGGSGRSRGTVASANSGLGLGRMSSSELFMNRPRWLGAPQSPPTPFLRLDRAGSTTDPPIAYDPPVHFHRSHSDPSSLTSGTDIASVSRYDDTPGLPPASWVRTPSLRAFPDSPLLHSPFTRADGGIDRAPFFHAGRSSFVPLPPTAAVKRQSTGGVSVLDRIAASFSVRSGLSNAGLGIDEEGDGAGRDDSRGLSGGGFLGTFSRPARSREISTESATDPFHHSLPLRPHTSPASPPRRPPRNVRRSQLRSSQTTPILFLPETDAPPLPFVALSSSAPAIGKRERGSSGRYSDPFEEDEGEVVWAGSAQEGERRPSKTVPDIASLQSVSG